MGTLRALCLRQLGGLFLKMEDGLASCNEQARQLDARKTQLLVELGAISDALEALHVCRTQLVSSREEFLEDTAGALPALSTSELCEELRSAARTSSPIREAPMAPGVRKSRLERDSGGGAGGARDSGGGAGGARDNGGGAGGARDSGGGAGRARDRVGGRGGARDSRGAAGGRASLDEKARRRAAVLPSDEHERLALLRRQLVVCDLPLGHLGESSLASALNAAFAAVPSFDAAAGDACCRVQMYAAGSYAFVTLRSEVLVLTALAFPRPILAGGEPIRLARPNGVEPTSGMEGLEVPSTWAPPDALASVEHGGPASTVTLEEKIYWSMRQAKSPKPSDKELREALAFFKQASKLLRRKRLVLDVCGSHGLIGGLFVAFGKARAAVVLDKFCPASFENVCTAWGGYIGRNGSVHEVGSTGDGSACRLHFCRQDFRRALPGFLAGGAASPISYADLGVPDLDPSEIAVVACHACSHLTDEIVDMCIQARVDFAVMPCCHRDTVTQGQMALVAATLGTSEHAAIDAARVGAISALGYDCRWRTIDASISPENRIIVGLAKHKAGALTHRAKVLEAADSKRGHIYAKIHHIRRDPFQQQGGIEEEHGATCEPCLVPTQID